MICKICNIEVKLSSFSNWHLKKKHDGISSKDYYDQFFKKEGEGICDNEGCTNETSFKRINQGYAGYCSKACTSRSSKIKAKSKATMLKNFGVEHALQSKDIRSKMEEKNIIKHGVKNVFQSEEIKNKIKESNNKNFGVDYPMQNKAILKKSVETNLKVYGVERPSQNKTIQNKIENTNMFRYNVKSTLQNKDTIDKINRTKRVHQWDIFLLLLKGKSIYPIFNKDFYLDGKAPFKYYCKICNKGFFRDTYNADRVYCGCLKKRSKYEDEIIKELEFFYFKKITPNRIFVNENKKRFECDIFIPDINFGIEFHGLYPHCEENKDSKYHQEKYLFFKELGIEIVQVFENEWKTQKEIVLSIIFNKIKINNNSIYARKCEIKDITDSEYKKFLIKNHIQGYATASIRLGLFFKDELILVTSFGKSRFNKNYQYELIRSCNKINTTVTGGFSKLLNHFEKIYNPDNIISYIDLRYFNGLSYTINGFEIITMNRPNYKYFHKNEKMLYLYHKSNFRKEKMRKLFENYNENLTEHENMLNNKYLRIYDAGTLTIAKNYIKDQDQ